MAALTEAPPAEAGAPSSMGEPSAAGETAAGINVRKGRVTNILDEGVVVPLLVHTSAINLATECVRLILKIDDIVITR